MPRAQFTLRSLLVAIIVVAAFFGGMAVQKQFDKPMHHRVGIMFGERDAITLPDGTIWIRYGSPEE